MSDVTYRPAAVDDLSSLVDVYEESCGDMLARYGLGANRAPRPYVLAVYRHVLQTGIFRLAEHEGRVVALASAIIRGATWYLSGFWVRPSLQRKGIGGPLVGSVFDAGRGLGATTFFVWSSVDFTAMASYMKLGMLPGYQLLQFAGAPRVPDAPAGYECVAMDADAAADLDRLARGAERPMDHAFWTSGGGPPPQCVSRGGRIVGYYYSGPSGIGPAVWREPQHAAPIMALALRNRPDPAAETRMTVPGPNHQAIRLALSCGLRLVMTPHLLTTAPFGRPDCYLPSGPALY